MIVYYRMCNIPSTNPPPVFADDKFRLNKLCLKSFVEVYKNIKPKVVFICDYCPPDYVDMIEEIVPFQKEIVMTEMGINETCLYQYKLYKQSNEQTVLFAECDYYWLKPMTEHHLEVLDLVSPYDHPDFYTRPDIHEQQPILQLVDDQHFRMASRNTMTFGMTRQAFEANLNILNKYGYLDDDVWRDMRANGYLLFTPIPTFATHMVRDYLSPTIDGKSQFI